MINLYFGLPGVGKTTLYSKIALDLSRRIMGGKTPIRHIYGNIELHGIPFYQQISLEYLGVYDLSECALLIDESTIEFDSRSYKNFSSSKTNFFVTYRHFHVYEIHLFCQIYNRVDKTIRDLTNNVFYMWKPFLLGAWFTRYVRIPYGIDIPKKSKDNSDSNGDISMGYYQPSLFDKILAPWFFRPMYYMYFDSWEAPTLPPLPELVSRDGEVISDEDFSPAYVPPSDISVRSYLR